VKKDLQEYWAKKWPRLQKLLVRYHADLQDVRLTVTYHQQNPQRGWYDLRAVIHLPTGTLVAEADEKEPCERPWRAGLDRAADALAREIKRHKELVRHDYLFKRKARRREDLGAAGPLLQKDKAGGRRDDFFRLLRPHLDLLRDYAGRELRMLELDGPLHKGEMTVTDLLDEVLTRAWQRFDEFLAFERPQDRSPRHLTLDLWLTDLLHETLVEWIKQEPRPHVSLEEKVPVRPDQVPQVDEQEWWSVLLGQDESLTLEDLLPDPEADDAWDELEAEEQRERLLSLLNELPVTQRQAFLLHALEDYGVAEIAMLQDRPEKEVRADIEAARQTLQERLRSGSHAQEPAAMRS
jgi:RNA polymerase sigma factor (sigma-70 family)